MSYNHYVMQRAEEINEALEGLPSARLLDVYAQEPPTENGPGELRTATRFKAVQVTEKGGKTSIVAVPSKRYTLVQHKDAFRPIIEGLVQAGVHDFEFITVTRGAKAQLQLYTGVAANDARMGVKLGIKVMNSYDGKNALTYGFTVRKWEGVWTVELVAYRLVCENGMKITVPIVTAQDLEDAERKGLQLGWKKDFVGSSELLAAVRTRIKHVRSAHSRVLEMQFVTEALALMLGPVQAYIERCRQWTFRDREQLLDIVHKHVGRRYAEKILRSYDAEDDNTLWGLYNAVTYVASHGNVAESARESLLNKASRLPLKVWAEAE